MNGEYETDWAPNSWYKEGMRIEAINQAYSQRVKYMLKKGSPEPRAIKQMEWIKFY